VGKRRKSTHLKLLEGNPSKRALNKAEPRFDPGVRCPQWLDKDAKGEWRRLAPQLKRQGLLTKGDFVLFCALTGVNYFFPSTTITFPVLLSYLDHGGNGMRA
jgi:phage terminase small subunit